METKRVWIIVALCVVAGVSLLYAAETQAGWLGSLALWAGVILMIVPIGMATNLTARRRRCARREDAPDSVEFQAAQAASSAAFADTLVLGTLLVLGLTVAPGPLPMLWGVLFLVAAIAVFGIRYAVALGQLRG